MRVILVAFVLAALALVATGCGSSRGARNSSSMYSPP
jgi:predicted small secreted protein